MYLFIKYIFVHNFTRNSQSLITTSTENHNYCSSFLWKVLQSVMVKTGHLGLRWVPPQGEEVGSDHLPGAQTSDPPRRPRPLDTFFG